MDSCHWLCPRQTDWLDSSRKSSLCRWNSLHLRKPQVFAYNQLLEQVILAVVLWFTYGEHLMVLTVSTSTFSTIPSQKLDWITGINHPHGNHAGRRRSLGFFSCSPSCIRVAGERRGTRCALFFLLPVCPVLLPQSCKATVLDRGTLLFTWARQKTFWRLLGKWVVRSQYWKDSVEVPNK